MQECEWLAKEYVKSPAGLNAAKSTAVGAAAGTVIGGAMGSVTGTSAAAQPSELLAEPPLASSAGC